MTLTRLSWPLLAVLGLNSCDKIKQVAEDVSSKVGGKLEERLEDPVIEPEVNPLMAWVDQNEEGVVFRKDIPFPADVRVLTKAKKKVNGRIFHESELGRKVETVNGKESIEADFERTGGTVLFTIKESNFSIPTAPTEEGGEPGSSTIQNPFQQAPPPKKTMTFSKQAGGWKGKGGGDFKLMAMSQQLSPVFGDLLIDNAVLPRKLWFSSSRMKIGDEITVTGAVLPMIVPGKAKGSLKIKLMEIGDVAGHPCGMFHVSGEYSRQGFPGLEGRLVNEEVTVESGELWLSLLYPMILKEKLKTIQTFSPSEGGSVVGRAQGTVDTLIIREWKAELPTVPPVAPPEAEAAPETPAASEAPSETAG